MNDRSGYTRLLAKWADQLGVGGRLWYEVGGKWQFDRTDAQINMDVHTGCA